MEISVTNNVADIFFDEIVRMIIVLLFLGYKHFSGIFKKILKTTTHYTQPNGYVARSNGGNNMNAVQSKRREIIEEKFMKMHEKVFRQIMNEEKNSYDSEIKLPMYDMLKDISTKKKYNIGNRGDDTICVYLREKMWYNKKYGNKNKRNRKISAS